VTAGTLGLWVRRGQGSERYALSNNHVLAASNEATPGDFIRQPGRADEVVLEEWVATPVPTIGEPAGIRDFQLGDRVQKTGRTTEHTRGLVETVGAQVQVDCGTGTATYDDQLVVRADAGEFSGLFARGEGITIVNRISHVVSLLAVRL
jgi:hypothetical protein